MTKATDILSLRTCLFNAVQCFFRQVQQIISYISFPVGYEIDREDILENLPNWVELIWEEAAGVRTEDLVVEIHHQPVTRLLLLPPHLHAHSTLTQRDGFKDYRLSKIRTLLCTTNCQLAFLPSESLKVWRRWCTALYVLILLYSIAISWSRSRVICVSAAVRPTSSHSL